MRGEIVTLRTNQRCQDCGRTLTKGSQARMYRKPDGSVAFYCLGNHLWEKENNPSNQDDVVSLLKEVVSLLEKVVTHLMSIEYDVRKIRLLLEYPVSGKETSGSEESESNDEGEFPF